MVYPFSSTNNIKVKPATFTSDQKKRIAAINKAVKQLSVKNFFSQSTIIKTSLITNKKDILEKKKLLKHSTKTSYILDSSDSEGEPELNFIKESGIHNVKSYSSYIINHLGLKDKVNDKAVIFTNSIEFKVKLSLMLRHFADRIFNSLYIRKSYQALKAKHFSLTKEQYEKYAKTIKESVDEVALTFKANHVIEQLDSNDYITTFNSLFDYRVAIPKPLAKILGPVYQGKLSKFKEKVIEVLADKMIENDNLSLGKNVLYLERENSNNAKDILIFPKIVSRNGKNIVKDFAVNQLPIHDISVIYSLNNTKAKTFIDSIVVNYRTKNSATKIMSMKTYGEVLKDLAAFSKKEDLIIEHIKNILQNREHDDYRDSENRHAMNYADKLVQLLFITELQRNIATIFTAPMYLELIAEQGFDQFKQGMGDTIFPMVTEGAVSMNRNISRIYQAQGILPNSHYMDFNRINGGGGGEVLLDLEGEIFIKWLDKNTPGMGFKEVVLLLDLITQLEVLRSKANANFKLVSLSEIYIILNNLSKLEKFKDDGTLLAKILNPVMSDGHFLSEYIAYFNKQDPDLKNILLNSSKAYLDELFSKHAGIIKTKIIIDKSKKTLSVADTKMHLNKIWANKAKLQKDDLNKSALDTKFSGKNGEEICNKYQASIEEIFHYLKEIKANDIEGILKASKWREYVEQVLFTNMHKYIPSLVKLFEDWYNIKVNEILTSNHEVSQNLNTDCQVDMVTLPNLDDIDKNLDSSNSNKPSGMNVATSTEISPTQLINDNNDFGAFLIVADDKITDITKSDMSSSEIRQLTVNHNEDEDLFLIVTDNEVTDVSDDEIIDVTDDGISSLRISQEAINVAENQSSPVGGLNHISKIYNLSEAPPAFIVEDVPRDGNCFYTAIATQLNKSPHTPCILTANDIREQAIDEILQNQNLYLSFIGGELKEGDDPMYFDKYITEHSKNGTWVDNTMIQATANNFSLEIEIYHGNGRVFFITPSNGFPPAKNLMIFYTGNHYAILMDKEDAAPPLTITSKRDHYEESEINKYLKLESSISNISDNSDMDIACSDEDERIVHNNPNIESTEGLVNDTIKDIWYQEESSDSSSDELSSVGQVHYIPYVDYAIWGLQD